MDEEKVNKLQLVNSQRYIEAQKRPRRARAGYRLGNTTRLRARQKELTERTQTLLYEGVTP
jgi:hypothetical protein